LTLRVQPSNLRACFRCPASPHWAG
jgi:hypothetical protein